MPWTTILQFLMLFEQAIQNPTIQADAARLLADFEAAVKAGNVLAAMHVLQDLLQLIEDAGVLPEKAKVAVVHAA